MPRISQFYGIVIAMFYDDHHPPHFHCYYAEHRAIIGIETLGVLAGSLPKRALNMVLEWAQQHQDELRENWQRARRHLPLSPIAPLD